MQIDDGTRQRPARASQSRTQVELSPAELAELLEQCPAEVRDQVAEESAELRGHPAQVLGRDSQLNKIERQLRKVAHGPKQRGSTKAQAVVDAPGAGKSTMLRELRKRLEATNVNVITMTASQIGDPERFSRRLREVPPWDRKDYRDRIAQALTTGGDKVLDQLISTLLSLGANQVVRAIQAIRGLEAPDIEPIHATLQAWREGRTPSIADMMRTLQNTNDQGTVIIIDEAQELAGYEKGDPRRENAAEIMRMMNDPDNRADRKVWNVTMLLAGMQDTPVAIQGLTTIEPETTELGPVDPTTVRAMIASGIERAQATDGTKTMAKAQWIEPLAQRYGDWTRHAQCAAEAARIVLTAGGDRAIHEPWGWALVLAKADEERLGLYREIERRATRHDIPGGLRTTTMLALQQHDGRLPEEDLTKLVEHWLQQHKPEADHATISKLAKQRIHAMQRTGMIGRRKNKYIAPIPSLMDHMTRETPEQLARAQATIDSAGLGPQDPGGNPSDE